MAIVLTIAGCETARNISDGPEFVLVPRLGPDENLHDDIMNSQNMTLEECLEAAHSDDIREASIAMYVLAIRYWNDDRALSALREIFELSAPSPGKGPQPIPVKWRVAHNAMNNLLLARGVAEDWAGARTNVERYDRLKAIMAEHPDWEGFYDGQREPFLRKRRIYSMIRLCLDEGGVESLSLAMDYPDLISDAYLQRNSKAIMDEMRLRGSVVSGDLLSRLVHVEGRNIYPLVDNLLGIYETGADISMIFDAIDPIFVKEDWVRYLRHQNSSVALIAASRYANRYPTRGTFAELSDRLNNMDNNQEYAIGLSRILGDLSVHLRMEEGRIHLMNELSGSSWSDMTVMSIVHDLIRTYGDDRTAVFLNEKANEYERRNRHRLAQLIRQALLPITHNDNSSEGGPQ
jgi:hypothetical protein